MVRRSFVDVPTFSKSRNVGLVECGECQGDGLRIIGNVILLPEPDVRHPNPFASISVRFEDALQVNEFSIAITESDGRDVNVYAGIWTNTIPLNFVEALQRIDFRGVACLPNGWGNMNILAYRTVSIRPTSNL